MAEKEDSKADVQFVEEGVLVMEAERTLSTDMKIVTLGSSGIVLTSFRFLTSACHFRAQTQRGLRMFRGLRLNH